MASAGRDPVARERPPDSTTPRLGRRHFIGAGSILVAGVLGGALRSELRALARAALPSDGSGTLGPPDEFGISVPDGFVARVVGRPGDVVPGTDLVWPEAPDGGACFPTPSGRGHVYVANSEVSSGGGGASAIDFDANGRVVGARSILSGTSMNCSGGATPWGTWLSCEEVDPSGAVWECDPGGAPAVLRPPLGTFRHEAVAVDADREQLFLTEDDPHGRLYRFRPARWPDLSSGTLEAARVVGNVVRWVDVDPSRPERSSETTPFDGGEGVVVSGRSLLFATKGDRRIWEIDLVRRRLSVFHDCIERPDTALTHVDALGLHPVTGNLFVAEDGGDMNLCMLARADPAPIVTRLVRFDGHDDSEVTGPAFSPDGRDLYLSSQRGTDGRGVTVQVTGPFARWIRSITDGASVGRVQRIGNEQRRPLDGDVRPGRYRRFRAL